MAKTARVRRVWITDTFTINFWKYRRGVELKVDFFDRWEQGSLEEAYEQFSSDVMGTEVYIYTKMPIGRYKQIIGRSLGKAIDAQRVRAVLPETGDIIWWVSEHPLLVRISVEKGGEKYEVVG